MKDRKVVVANHKMNLTADEIKKYLSVINPAIKSDQVVICPTSVYVPYFLGHDYGVGVQNIYFEEDGPYTGELSCEQAYSLGVRYVIVGHSERRNSFKETNTSINNKVLVASSSNMGVILCVGESEEERLEYKSEDLIKRQITSGLKNIDTKYLKNVVIAYEPIWAIGTNKVPKNAEIIEMTLFIKSVVKDLYDYDIKVLYGGSVNAKNIKTINKIKEVSGFLVGGASIKAEEFLKIIEVVVNQ